MDDLVLSLVTAIVVAVISFIIGWTKKQDYDVKMEDAYVKYKLFFDVSGQVIKAIDEQLYNELEQALTRMKTAYESPEFTTEAFQEILKECQDVFNRAKALLNKS